MKKLSFLFFLLILLPLVNALDIDQYNLVIVNSNDWKDVYSGILFSKLLGKKVMFMGNQGNDIINLIDPKVRKILIIEGDIQKYLNLKALLESKGFSVDEYSKQPLNYN